MVLRDTPSASATVCIVAFTNGSSQSIQRPSKSIQYAGRLAAPTGIPVTWPTPVSGLTRKSIGEWAGGSTRRSAAEPGWWLLMSGGLRAVDDLGSAVADEDGLAGDGLECGGEVAGSPVAADQGVVGVGAEVLVGGGGVG